MIKLMDKYDIIQRHLSGDSNRCIAKDLGINRKTVNKYVTEYVNLQERILGPGRSNLEEVRRATEAIMSEPKYKKRKSAPRKWNKEMDGFLDEILASEEEKRIKLRTSKQQLTNVQIHQIMLDNGFEIGATTVNNKINEKRAKSKEAFIAQSYHFGQRFEYDFGEVHLYLGNVFTKLFLAVMTAPASGYRFALLYRNQKFDVFVDSQVRFFEHMGGCFEEGVYDNMRNVVSKFIGKTEKEINPKLLSLASYYGFKVNVTNCFAGNEKGSVESAVKVIRNAAFAATWRFKDLKEAQAHLDEVLANLNADKNLEGERAGLSLWRPPYEVADIRTCVRVDKYSCIHVDKSLYSVPDTLVEKNVTVKAYPREIVVIFAGEEIARHARASHEGEMVLDIEHYLRTLMRKPGALRNSTALAANVKLKSIFDQSYSNCPKEFLQIVERNRNKSIDELVNALEAHGIDSSQNKVPNMLSPIEAQTLSQISAITAPGRCVA